MQVQASLSQQPSSRNLNIPIHVAIIMDGNGRWAKQRGLPRLEGHRVGVDRIQHVLETLGTQGVKYVTLYAFSTENWHRPQEEVAGLLDILQDALQRQARALHENNVRIFHIGKLDRLSPGLQEAVGQVQELTSNNTGINLNVAFDYGGRDEILEAIRRILQDGIPPEKLDQEMFSRYLYTAHCPDPDLIIRTGGEQRTSNFLLWQSAYSEYYYTPTLWPDLDSDELEQVMDSFGSRQRRFGRVSPEG